MEITATHAVRYGCLLFASCLSLAGCPKSERLPGGDDKGKVSALEDGGMPDPDAPDAAAPICARDGDARPIENVDILFVIDNSMSMREEQQALREQFPRLIRAIVTGDADDDGMRDFPAPKRLHLGVVSSDMGLPNVPNSATLGCRPMGDDGVLLHAANDPMLADCRGDYPAFLSVEAGIDPRQAASDLSCVASIGTGGCGFEQQLEAGLKALWPSGDANMSVDPPAGGPFLADELANADGTRGHGTAANAGFLDPEAQGRTLLAIFVVSDEEDCSSQSTHHFIRSEDLPDGDPIRDQIDLNLRCFQNKQNLFPVDRYVDGFKSLRPGTDLEVLFGAIVGVPPDLVSDRSLASVDFDVASQRETFYRHVLDDPRMQEVIDPEMRASGTRNLTPSCKTSAGVAFPPRRIVEVAQRFGADSVIQSICESNFEPAARRIAERIGRKLEGSCRR